MSRTGESFRLLLALNAVPVVGLLLLGVAWWQGSLSVRLPPSAVSVVAMLTVGAVLSAALGFFAAPAAQQACIENRRLRDALRRRQARAGLGFVEAQRLRLRRGWLWLTGALVVAVSWAVHLALLATLLAILGLTALGAWLAWQLVMGRI